MHGIVQGMQSSQGGFALYLQQIHVFFTDFIISDDFNWPFNWFGIGNHFNLNVVIFGKKNKLHFNSSFVLIVICASKTHLTHQMVLY